MDLTVLFFESKEDKKQMTIEVDLSEVISYGLEPNGEYFATIETSYGEPAFFYITKTSYINLVQEMEARHNI